MESVISASKRAGLLPDVKEPDSPLALLVLACKQILGTEVTQALLDKAEPGRDEANVGISAIGQGADAQQYAQLEQAIEDFHGPRGAPAMLVRVGRTCFQLGAEAKGRPWLKSVPFVSMQAKIKLLLQEFAAGTAEGVEPVARLEEHTEAFYLVVDSCACYYRPQHTSPCCFVTVGRLMEATKWLTGREFEVSEVTCLNTGADACRFRIPKQPSA